MTKKEQKQKQALLEALKIRKMKYEDNPKVQAYLKYLKLSPEQKQTLAKKWDGYYESERNTKAHRRFVTQKEALKKGDIATVIQLGKETAEARKTLVPARTPSSIDPDVLLNSQEVHEYKKTLNMLGELMELSSQYDQAREIFGVK